MQGRQKTKIPREGSTSNWIYPIIWKCPSKVVYTVENDHVSAVADHVISTGHNIKWDHLEILASGKSDLQCRIKETLLINDLNPSLNENVGNEKLLPY